MPPAARRIPADGTPAPQEQQAYHTRQHKETVKQLQELTRGFRQQ